MICEKCGSGIPIYTNICPDCGAKNDYKAKSFRVRMVNENNSLVGIKGWLILVAINVFCAPILYLYSVVTEIVLLNATYDFLNDPYVLRSNHFIYYVIMHIAVFCEEGLLGALIYLAYLFGARKRKMVSWFIGTTLFSLGISFIFPFIYYFYVHSYDPSTTLTDFWDKPTTNAFIRAILSSCIWIPYMLRSKRVKATFTR